MEWYFIVLQKYATFKGRARRKEYWMFVLVNFVVTSILAAVAKMMKAPAIETVYTLAMFLPSLAASTRRFHDINRRGWWVLVPLYNIYLLCLEGDSGANQYGEDPKASERPQASSSGSFQAE